MPVKLQISPEIITAYIFGDIDHHTAASMRENIDNAIEKNNPLELIINFQAVTFMDSSGIGLVMGRYKLMNEIGGKVTLAGLNDSTNKIMRLAGLEKLVKLQCGGK